MFARDRDLLALEPNLFETTAWVGQRLLEGTGDVSGTTLTLTSPGSFESSGVGAGSVVVFNGVAHEVVERLGSSSVMVSRMRGSETDAPVAPPSAVDGSVQVPSFGPQLGLVHAQVLRMLGIEPGDNEARPSEADVTNPEALRLVEALGALHLIYAAASALSPAGSGLSERASLYRELFAQERMRAAARVDLDGDGRADATRRLNVVQFIRG